MPHQLSTAAVSIVCGTVISFSADVPVSGIEIADRVGIAGIAVWLIWWMLNNFSKRLDRLTEAIERLGERVTRG